MITQEILKKYFLYDQSTGVFTRLISLGNKRAGTIAGYPNSEGYIHFMIEGFKYKAHRLAWLYVYGILPEQCRP